MRGGPEPAAEGVVDEEVVAAVDDEAEVADAEHDAEDHTEPVLNICSVDVKPNLSKDL